MRKNPIQLSNVTPDANGIITIQTDENASSKYVYMDLGSVNYDTIYLTYRIKTNNIGVHNLLETTDVAFLPKLYTNYNNDRGLIVEYGITGSSGNWQPTGGGMPDESLTHWVKVEVSLNKQTGSSVFTVTDDETSQVLVNGFTAGLNVNIGSGAPVVWMIKGNYLEGAPTEEMLIDLNSLQLVLDGATYTYSSTEKNFFSIFNVDTSKNTFVAPNQPSGTVNTKFVSVNMGGVDYDTYSITVRVRILSGESVWNPAFLWSSSAYGCLPYFSLGGIPNISTGESISYEVSKGNGNGGWSKSVSGGNPGLNNWFTYTLSVNKVNDTVTFYAVTDDDTVLVNTTFTDMSDTQKNTTVAQHYYIPTAVEGRGVLEQEIDLESISATINGVTRTFRDEYPQVIDYADLEVLVDADFNQNEFRNAVIENLESAPLNPVAGQTYFNTTLGRAYTYDGTKWVDITAEGDYTFQKGVRVDGTVVSLDIATNEHEGNIALSLDNSTGGLKAEVAEGTTSEKGLIEIATDSEATTGTSEVVVINPKQLTGAVSDKITLTDLKVPQSSSGLITLVGGLTPDSNGIVTIPASNYTQYVQLFAGHPDYNTYTFTWRQKWNTVDDSAKHIAVASDYSYLPSLVAFWGFDFWYPHKQEAVGTRPGTEWITVTVTLNKTTGATYYDIVEDGGRVLFSGAGENNTNKSSSVDITYILCSSYAGYPGPETEIDLNSIEVTLDGVTYTYGASSYLTYDSTTGRLGANVDTTVTSNSTNLITSNAVFDAITTAADGKVEYMGSWNAQGQSDYSSITLPVKKGYLYYVSGGSDVTIDGITWNEGDYLFVIEDVASGGTLTSAKVQKIDSTESSDIVRTNATQTLTNKTISGTSNTVTDVPFSAVANDAVVTYSEGIADTDNASDSEFATEKAIASALDTRVDVFSVTNPALTPVSNVATWTFTNEIGNADVVVEIRKVDTGKKVFAEVVITSSTITVKFNKKVQVSADTYEAVVIGNDI